MKFTFYFKDSTYIGYGEDAEVALKSLFGRITDDLLDGIIKWERE